MKNPIYMILLGINIILLLLCFMFPEMNELILYVILGIVMVTTPLYLYLQFRSFIKEVKK